MSGLSPEVMRRIRREVTRKIQKELRSTDSADVTDASKRNARTKSEETAAAFCRGDYFPGVAILFAERLGVIEWAGEMHSVFPSDSSTARPCDHSRRMDPARNRASREGNYPARRADSPMGANCRDGRQVFARYTAPGSGNRA
jgi:hypothetical protein